VKTVLLVCHANTCRSVMAQVPRFTLEELTGETGDVADPFGLEDAACRACRDEIERCLAKGLDRLLAVLES
jgi:protein-tyrosine-phosphatase